LIVDTLQSSNIQLLDVSLRHETMRMEESSLYGRNGLPVFFEAMEDTQAKKE
jgi:hypothetical protein